MRFLLPIVTSLVLATGAVASEEPTPAAGVMPSVLVEPQEQPEEPVTETCSTQVVVGYRPIYARVQLPRVQVQVAVPAYVPVAYPTGCWARDRWIRRQMIRQIRWGGAIAVPPLYMP